MKAALAIVNSILSYWKARGLRNAIWPTHEPITSRILCCQRLLMLILIPFFLNPFTRMYIPKYQIKTNFEPIQLLFVSSTTLASKQANNNSLYNSDPVDFTRVKLSVGICLYQILFACVPTCKNDMALTRSHLT